LFFFLFFFFLFGFFWGFFFLCGLVFLFSFWRVFFFFFFFFFLGVVCVEGKRKERRSFVFWVGFFFFFLLGGRVRGVWGLGFFFFFCFFFCSSPPGSYLGGSPIGLCCKCWPDGFPSAVFSPPSSVLFRHVEANTSIWLNIAYILPYHVGFDPRPTARNTWPGVFRCKIFVIPRFDIAGKLCQAR